MKPVEPVKEKGFSSIIDCLVQYAKDGELSPKIEERGPKDWVQIPAFLKLGIIKGLCLKFQTRSAKKFQEQNLYPALILPLYYFAQCVHRIGASLVGRSAAPPNGMRLFASRASRDSADAK